MEPVGIVIGVIGDDDRGEVGIERLEGHLPAQLDAVDIVEIDIVHDVLIETVAVAHLECEAGGDRFGQRPGHMAAHQLLVVIAIGCGQAAAIGEFGARAVDADRAADHVLAQQHALRPADHFDAIDIEQVEVEQARTTHVNVIDEDPDRLVGRGRVEAGIGDPANVEFLVERRQRGKGQRGRLPCEILERQRPVFSSASPEKAEIAAEVSWTDASRRCAVTTIVVSWFSLLCEAALSSPSASCACAGLAAAIAATNARVLHFDAQVIPISLQSQSSTAVIPA